MHSSIYRHFRSKAEVFNAVVQEAYAEIMTRLIAVILANGVEIGEFRIDAVTVFVQPAHVATTAHAGIAREPDLHRPMTALITAFAHGVQGAPAI